MIIGISFFRITTDTYINDKKEFFDNKRIQLLSEMPGKRAIDCFDVRHDGIVVIGTRSITPFRYIYVLDSDGNFLYGYSFYSSGSFLVEWIDENVKIIFVRDGVMLTLDRNANCVFIEKFTMDQNINSAMNALRSPIRTHNSHTYKLTKRFDGSFYRLSLETNNTTTIIYEAPIRLGDIWVSWILFPILLLVFIFSFINYYKTRKTL